MGPEQKEKKQLLQKLMANLIGKPGRSFHELSNGVKQAISTYKNFSKEWDTIHGAGQAPASGINRVLDTVKQKKEDGSGGPGMPQAGQVPQFRQMPQQAQGVPQRPSAPPVRVNGGQPQPVIAGPEQTSTFNRPAPVSSLGIHGF